MPIHRIRKPNLGGVGKDMLPKIGIAQTRWRGFLDAMTEILMPVSINRTSPS